MGGVHDHDAPQHGVERCRGDQHPIGGHRLPARSQLAVHQAGHVVLHPRRPAQVSRGQQEPRQVPTQPARAAAKQCRRQAHQQGQGVERVDDEDAAQAVGLAGERQGQAGAVDGHRIQQRVGDQHQPHGQEPSREVSLSGGRGSRQRCRRSGTDGLLAGRPCGGTAPAHPPGDAGGQRHRRQGLPEQGVGFGAVQHHVQHRIAVVEQRVQVRQGAQHATPQGRLPHGSAAPHDGHTDGGAQRQLRQGIHGPHHRDGAKSLCQGRGTWQGPTLRCRG